MASLYTLAGKNILKTRFYLAGFLGFVIFIGWVISYLLQSQAILIAAIILGILMNIGSYFYSDKIVLAITGAKPIKKEENPELYRIVENLSITAGLPMPRIYLIDEEQPNAFATGRNPKNAVVAVTRGLLEKLERRELEGVISHELAHIGNRDILLSTIVVVLVGIVILLVDFFFRITFWGGFGSRTGSRNRKGGGGLLMIIALIFLILAPILAQILKFAISRKREFLADATGALLTRDPEGLAWALEKISSDQAPMRTANNATAHLYFFNPFRQREKRSWFFKLFMTHPPVEERIEALRKSLA